MRITVFTPTYNREYILGKLYESLKRQTFTDFEWLIIDDGSEDDTKKLVEKWSKEKKEFSIRYYYFENSGKQREINRALDLARGELFFTVDSDDILTNDALEKIDRWEKALPKDKKFCGLAGSDGDMTGKATNPLFKGEYIDATFLNRYAETGLFIGHDRPWVLYTEVHKKYKYPEFEGESFITEAVAWNRMAQDGYQIRCFNDVIYMREHQEDGLTNSILRTLIENPRGYGLWLNEMMQQLDYSYMKRLKVYYSFYSDLRETYQWRDIVTFINASILEMFLIKICFGLKHRRK
ncbi:glycosyltransferase family 2 protein [Anaerostipes butyraticus]|uniref:Glycosyltransferase 2-like domain-containing protein n=1 Tax=Anaerostipes butyraticus TaxID=645466 RepID=A0A916QBI1_9FIRM|nr:glycosyltransferase family 2 protein [Anaerostipes butyraticus]GFO86210.1 hypothetical protein ANBU17_25570 [Anaerostipes butyraticus]